ncbi:MAG: class I SAM-dependent methyltransferase [Gemmatimonadota bacterium]
MTARDDSFDFFEEKYARPRTPTQRRMEREALGHDAGLNGYTTVEQARVLGERLALGSSSVLLDVGAGFGWPGSYIARANGCHLLSTDVPCAALQEARRAADSRDSPHSPTSPAVRRVVAADGRALPLRSRSIDAIVHADVFC